MKLAARRFRDIIIRRRELPGMRDGFGEWQAGATMAEELRANVQPIRTVDEDLEGAVQLSQRLRVYVLPRRELVSTATSTLLWNGDPVTFQGDPLTLFMGAEVLDEHALAAAFAAAGADKVVWGGVLYTVEESRTWPAYTRATIIREL